MNTKHLSRVATTPKHLPLKFLQRLVGSFQRNNEDQWSLHGVTGALRAGEFLQAITVAETRASQLHSALKYGEPPSQEYLYWSQVAQLLKKVPFVEPKLQPELVAWKKFLAAEHRCRRINQRLRAERRCNRYSHASHREVARSWIRKVLGDEPDLYRILEMCGFGPGASIGVHGQDTSQAAKLEADSWTVTPTCAPYATCALSGDYHISERFYAGKHGLLCYDSDLLRDRLHARLKMVDFNKIVMVPKTAKTHRTIAIEPLLNGYVQKGVDLFMRSCLKAFGIDLSDQTRNQKLACIGSSGEFNTFVTIDLSSASDSIAIETVRDLLPPEWFNFLCRIRSPRYESAWGSGTYEKFASMGNGFCFPLETLIFASLCVAANVATGEREFSVYGDDIIVRQSAALLTIELLARYGFETNVDKTFIFGPFRESCGADFVNGVNVRPYTLDFLPLTDRDVMKVHNGLLANDIFTDVTKPAVDWMYRSYLHYLPHKPPHHTTATDDAVLVPEDIYMSHWSSSWHRDEQRWRILRLTDIGIARKGDTSVSTQMYGLLRGIKSDRLGLPEFTLRRKTRTVASLS